MSTTGAKVPAGTTTGGDSRRSGTAMIAGLAVTQTVGYGTLYYAFAVLHPTMAADLGASTSIATGALTANVLTGAVLALPVGWWLDRRGGRALMTTGSAAGALLLVAWAQVDSVAGLYAVQVGIGAATAASLYEAAFAVTIAWLSPARRAGALLAITVVAGFASTIFLPLTGWLVDRHGWRSALLILAVVQALTIPAHALLVRRPATWSRSAGEDVGGRPHSSAVRFRFILTDRGFWLLAVGFTLHTAAVSAFTVHIVAALVAWGHRPTLAATIAGLLGVLSVAGRLVTVGLQRRYRTTAITAGIFGVQAAAAALLPVVGTATAGAVGGVIGFGLGFGVATIARPILIAERYDTARYATMAGLLVAPATLAKASGPLAAATIQSSAGSYPPVLAAIAVCCAFAAITIALAGTSHVTRPAR